MTALHTDIINYAVLPEAESTAFQSMYAAIRQKEKRVYTDEEVALLPLIHKSHVHCKEWQVRRRSANRMYNYLEKKKPPLSILEVGCGNGWLTAKMASLPLSALTGIDINRIELQQARRVFAKCRNIEFVETDLRLYDPARKQFDIIVFAASLSWFHSLEDIIPAALSFLKEDGEIHIIDSFFYKPAAIDAAKESCRSYYLSLGYPDMASLYFHHSMDALKIYHPTFLYKPQHFKNKILRNTDPFPWVVICHP